MIIKNKILVISDNLKYIKQLSEILKEDFNLLGCTNVNDGIRYLNEDDTIQIALLGLNDQDANMTFLKIKNNDKFIKLIPVIGIVEQKYFDEQVEFFLDNGASDFILYPFNESLTAKRIVNFVGLSEQTKIIQNVMIDGLTEVYSSEFFYHLMTQSLENEPQRTYDLICFDIESFKLINDLFGTDEGDKVLKTIASACKNYIFGKGIIGRLGSDNFVCLIIRDKDFENSLFNELDRVVQEYPINTHITLKYGVYEIIDLSIEPSVMCDRAILACNTIKGKYGERVAIYSDDLRSNLLEEKNIIDDMQKALETKQFEVYYQPKFDLITNQVVGSEALIRWNHPTRGLLMPGVFIPLFEKNGFISMLDQYVWEEVCIELRRLIDNNFEVLPISVNVSRCDIYLSNIVDILVSLCQKYNIDTKLLHLEVTETSYTENPQQLIKVIRQLKKLGFVIEMDDFGSGYSSLNMLNELPIDILKLDMGFVQDKSIHINGNTIIIFIVSLAKWLGLSVIAEGVETKEQVEALKDIGCKYAQGYYYDKPLRAMDYEELLKKELIYEEIAENKLMVSEENEEIYDYTMLIVNDDCKDIYSLYEIFKNEFNVVVKTSGKEAIEYLAHNMHVDICIIDLNMKNTDGFKLIESLKTSEFGDIPFIVSSSFNMQRLNRALKLGASDCINKPYHPGLSRSRVSNVLAMKFLREIRSDGSLLSVIEMKEIVDSTLCGLFIYAFDFKDKNHEILFYNKGLCKILGYAIDEFEVIKNSVNFIYEEDLEYVNRELKKSIMKKKDFAINYRIVRKDGSKLWVHFSGNKIRESVKRCVYHCMLIDINDDYIARKALKNRAECDPLTKVFNRMEFERRVNDYLCNNDDGIFIMLDLDNFKKINDLLGHLKGDETLKRVTSILKEFFRPQDIISRMGGDEFAIFIRGQIPVDNLKKRLGELCRRLTFKCEMDDNYIEVSSSIGVCIVSDKANTYELLYRYADDALLNSKRSGKNCYYIYNKNM